MITDFVLLKEQKKIFLKGVFTIFFFVFTLVENACNFYKNLLNQLTANRLKWCSDGPDARPQNGRSEVSQQQSHTHVRRRPWPCQQRCWIFFVCSSLSASRNHQIYLPPCLCYHAFRTMIRKNDSTPFDGFCYTHRKRIHTRKFTTLWPLDLTSKTTTLPLACFFLRTPLPAFPRSRFIHHFLVSAGQYPRNHNRCPLANFLRRKNPREKNQKTLLSRRKQSWTSFVLANKRKGKFNHVVRRFLFHYSSLSRLFT